MLQAQFVSLLFALGGLGDAAELATYRAASAYAESGQSAARQAMANLGFYPFSYGRVDGGARAQDEGHTHCAAIPDSEALFCARLVLRVVDSSPVHLSLRPLSGFELLHAHAVASDGRVRKFYADEAGIIDLPAPGSAFSLGVSVRGEAGPETGLYLRLPAVEAPSDPCRYAEHLGDLLSDINVARSALGHRPLRASAAPAAYAKQRSDELKERFGHSPGGLGSLLRKHQLKLRLAAEVVAEDASLAAICRGWLLSPSHRAALLDRRRDEIAFVRRGERLNALLWRKAP
jgi:hypothetical protein